MIFSSYYLFQRKVKIFPYIDFLSVSKSIIFMVFILLPTIALSNTNLENSVQNSSNIFTAAIGWIVGVLAVVIAGTVIQSIMVLSDAKSQIIATKEELSKKDDEVNKSITEIKKIESRLKEIELETLRLERRVHWDNRPIMKNVYSYSYKEKVSFESSLRTASKSVARISVNASLRDKEYIEQLLVYVQDEKIRSYLYDLLGGGINFS